MKKNQLGRSDLQVSNLCLGTMMYGTQTDTETAYAQMDAALASGINIFDTAELYSVPPSKETQGRSEEIVGSWLADRKARDAVLIATKVAGRSGMLSYLRDGPRVRKADIITACEGSLRRLQIETIDYYQVHWPDRKIQLFGSEAGGYRHYPDDHYPIEEVVETMQALQNQGKIRYYGLSNETPWGVAQYIRCAGDNTAARPMGIQNCYNIGSRFFEAGLAEYAMQEQVGLLAYSPLAQGLLSGKYLDDKTPTGSRKELMGGRLFRDYPPQADTAVRRYMQLAQDFSMTPCQLAMIFCMSRPWVTSTIFGATTQAQFDEILGACDLEYTEALEAAVETIHRELPNACP